MKKFGNFALNPDENTLKQFSNCLKNDFVLKASLMPDAHSGYVAPIGSVFLTKDFIVPSWVGYDIGCGMIAMSYKREGIVLDIKKNVDLIYDLVLDKIPMGKGKLNSEKNISLKTRDEFKKLLKELSKKEINLELFKEIKNKGISNLGTLGSGNHFIEILFEEGSLDVIWLVIHSGSRNIGHKIGESYMKIAAKKENDYEETFPLKINSEEGIQYKNFLFFALDFALLNRLEMVYVVEDILKDVLSEDVSFELWVNKNHNHALSYENKDDLFIHRKGATPASLGERGVIPANMRDGCFLVEGLGNLDFLESSSHGAGRVMSRNKSKFQINFEDFKKSMEGIKGTVIKEVIDESPFVYKNIYDVMEKQKDSVKIIKHLKPILNWKGL